MQISRCSLSEFKIQFPKFKPADTQENTNLSYYKIVLDDKEFIGLIKDTETKLFEFVDLDKGKKYLKEDPNFEYSFLSLFAENHETRNFDTPITGPAVNVFELEETVDNELKSLRRWNVIMKIVNILGFAIVIALVALVLYLQRIGKL